MLEEKDIARHCDSRVLRRARNIARAADSIHSRRCQYEPGSVSRMKLRARVASGQDWRQSYDIVLQIDEAERKVRSYDCTCQESLSQMGMCKHVAAAALAFLAHPQTYVGYEADRRAASSESIVKLIESARSARPACADDAAEDADGTYGREDHLGDIRIDVMLVRDADKWTARFRVADRRARYTVKDLDAFVDALDAQARHSYGNRLEFAHRASAFEEHSRSITLFIEKSVKIRRELEADQLSGFHVRPAELKGELALSVPELVELLGLSEGVDLFVDDLNELDHKLKKTHIVHGNPPVRAVFEAEADGGFTVRREGSLSFAQFGQAFYVWYGQVFYLCDPGFEKCADFLRYVYCDPAASQYISRKDAPEFCASVLPVLERELEVLEPEKMRQLKPVDGVVELYFDYTSRSCTCAASVLYGSERVDLFDAPGATPAALAKGIRNLAAEQHVKALLRRYFPVVEGKTRATADEPLKLADSADIAHLLFSGLKELGEVAQVFTTPAFDRLISRRRPHAVVGLSIKSHLVDLSVSSEDFDSKELAEILQSYRLRKRYHLLADGTYLDLRPAGLDEADAVLEEMGIDPMQLAQGDLLFEPYRAFQFDALVDDAHKTSAFKGLLKKGFADRAREHVLPAQLAFVMRPYQVEGFTWLNALADNDFGGILADEMGLGKSLQLISFLCERHGKDPSREPSLIVCPASLVYNWLAEFAKFAPHMEPRAIAGLKAERKEALRELRDAIEYGKERPDVIVTSYDLLKRDLDEYASIPFYCMALDEAQYIKNTSTQASRAAKSIMARHKFALTGTPIENRLSELWNIFDFLMPGLLGGYRQFRDKYEQPILNGDAERMERLQGLVSRFILRRLKKDVLKDLPNKNENVVFSQMAPDQRSLYHAHEQRLRESVQSKDSKSFNSERIAVLAELTRLRELCCDPRMVYEDYRGSSAKLDTVLELIESARDSGSKTLVFSQFTSYLDLISEELDARGIAFFTITGATPKRRRVELVDRFNSDDTPVFLVSLKAGGTGLNLIGASVVVHADPWWNSAAENQATDRSHRIGQTKEVSVYKVIAKDTIEERVVALQDAKSALADKLVGTTSHAAAPLSRDDLLALLEG